MRQYLATHIMDKYGNQDSEMPLFWKLMRLRPILIKNIIKCEFSSGPKLKVPPGPLPLENAKDQKEMERLIKSGGEQTQQTIITKTKTEFEGEANPETGEIGGPKGKEPTRFGDWEKNGRISDF